MELATRYGLLIFSLFLSGVCHSQMIEASLQKQGYLFINKYVDYISTENEISFNEVMLPATQKKFQKTNGKSAIFKGYDSYHYWYRFTISNNDTIVKQLILLMGQLGLRTAEVWKGHDNFWASLGKTGYNYSYNSRPYLFAHYAYPISVEPFTTDTLYVNADESHAYKVIAFALLEPKVMKRMENRFYYLFGIFTGILLFFSIINLYLYFSIRENIHLWYSLYIITILFFMLKHEGLDSQFLGLDSYYGYRSTSMAAFSILAVGLLMHVVQQFLTNISYTSKLYRITSFIKWLAWISAITGWLVFLIQPDTTTEIVIFEIMNKTGFAALGLIIINCIYSFIKGFKPSLFIFAGLSIFLLGIIIRGLFLSSESYIFPPSLFEIGLVVEAIIISFGLMYRYNRFKKDKERLVVELQTQSAEAAKQILFTQEAEQKRIALDLHDELGGNLAAIKMTLQTFNLPAKQSDTVKKLIDKASNNARNIAHNLMPPEFEEIKLGDLLKNYYKQLSDENTCKFGFHSSGSSTHFDKQDELMIYRIFMELSNNILKHAFATDATLQLIYYDKYLEIMAEDNGKGFSENRNDGIGLKSIYSRLNYLKGKITIDSGKSGTTIMIQIPYKR
ncbi:MAG: 7TM diverse intracellular signaling domain-containing protein [Ginsengibacter sp.]